MTLLHYRASCTLLTKKTSLTSKGLSIWIWEWEGQLPVAAWIWEWEGQPYKPVLFHKLQGQKADGFKDEDFIIILQTESQQQMFQQFGDKGICVDTTHGTNMYDFLLIKDSRGEWPSGLYSLRQVTEVKLGRVRSDSGWVTSEA